MIRYFETHGVLDNVRRSVVPSSRRGCARSHQRYRIAGGLRGRGLLYCLDFVDPATREGPSRRHSRSVPRSSRPLAGAGSSSAPSPHNATLAPPLVLTAAEVTEIADLFEESVAEVDEQVASGGGVEVDVAFGL